MKNKKIVFYGFMGMIISVGAANAAQIASKDYVDNANTSMTTYVDTVADTKADKVTTYTKTEIDTALAGTVSSGDLGALATKDTVGTIDIDDASVTKPKLSVDVQTSLDKADTALQSADLTGLATTTYVDTQDTALSTAIAGKADTTAVNAALATKADTTYVDTQDTALSTAIAGKADTTYVDTAVSTKADTTYVDTQDTALSTAIAAKADTADLNLKEDLANKSDDIAADTGSTTKYTTVNAVETYSIPKPSANCLGTQAQCVLAINKTDGSIYWEDVALPQ
ncbi:MAG: hypothetical protein JW974_03935 [Alphaproteobacteria bacterium]|nr:hypothetical protein [Alphaproteobacteria bacterium]MBN2675138.1 hypothetical protein [Alphaproteobacteria bacterium]